MRPYLEQLEDRTCPTTITYHGGQVLQTPHVANLFIGQYRADLDKLADIMSTDYTSYIGIYGVSRGYHNGTASIGSWGAISNAQVQQLLAYEIDIGALPTPDGNNQMYMVYLDNKIIDGNLQNAGAFHSYFNHNSVSVPYGVAYSFDTTFTGASHEMLETFTDPFLNGWWENYTGEEVADAGGGQLFKVDGIDVVQPVDTNGIYITSPTPYTALPPRTPSFIDQFTTYFYINALQLLYTYEYAAAVGDYATIQSIWMSLVTDVWEFQLGYSLGGHVIVDGQVII
jgi:hypothetical protein